MQQTDQNPEKAKKSPLLKSFFGCLVFMAAYLISFFIFDAGNNVKLNYIIFSPLAFILSWVFCYFYLLLKDASTLKYYLLGCMLIACAIIYTNGIFDIDIRIQNFFHSSTLPKKYGQYLDINNTKNRFGRHEIILFKASSNPIDQFLTKNNELIIHSLSKAKNANDAEPTIHMFYKLDKNGKQIDQYSYTQDEDKDTEILFEGYLINIGKHYFRSWPLDGDTTKNSIEIRNADLNWTADQQRQQLDDIDRKAQYFLSERIYDFEHSNSKNYSKKTYFMDDKWHIFCENISDDGNLNLQTVSRGRTVNDLFGHWDKNEWVTNHSPANIQSVYYQKIRRIRNRQDVNSGKYEQGDRWQGCLFSHLIVENDTLKFKDHLYLDEEWHWSQIEINGKNIGALTFEDTEQFHNYGYYSNAALNYQLFTSRRNRLYLIKRIDP